MEGSADRVAGELLEIWALNVLFKEDSSNVLLRHTHEIVDLASGPDQIAQTWDAHLLRAELMGLGGRPAHRRAVSLARAALTPLWATRYQPWEASKDECRSALREWME
ncbi:MAG: hypothetical protein LBG11_01845 [Bifidobacteriaceae bacterium]|nr:hypothetical protein [Bifidobacteriaceae bacterium]